MTASIEHGQGLNLSGFSVCYGSSFASNPAVYADGRHCCRAAKLSWPALLANFEDSLMHDVHVYIGLFDEALQRVQCERVEGVACHLSYSGSTQARRALVLCPSGLRHQR